MSVNRNAGDLLSLSTRWNEYTTSSAVIALPLANFAPERSLNVMSHCVPESLISQLCARAGLMVERSAPSNFTSVSYALWASRTPVNSYATAGSSEIRSLVSAYQTSVLAAPPVACGVGLPALGGGWLHAAATSSAMTKTMDERRYDMNVPPPAGKSSDEPSTGGSADGQSAHGSRLRGGCGKAWRQSRPHLRDTPARVQDLQRFRQHKAEQTDAEDRRRVGRETQRDDRRDHPGKHRVEDRDHRGRAGDDLRQPEEPAATRLHAHGDAHSAQIVVRAHHEEPLEIRRELEVCRPDAVHADDADRLVVIRSAEADGRCHADEEHDRQDDQSEEGEGVAEGRGLRHQRQRHDRSRECRQEHPRAAERLVPGKRARREQAPVFGGQDLEPHRGRDHIGVAGVRRARVRTGLGTDARAGEAALERHRADLPQPPYPTGSRMSPLVVR